MPTPIDNSIIGDYIAKCRKQKGLAEELGVTNKAVSKWERGKGLPDITLLPELSRVLGTTADGILSGGRAAAPAAPEDAEPPAAPVAAGPADTQGPAAQPTDGPQSLEQKAARPGRLRERLSGKKPSGRVVAGGLLLCGAAGVFLAQLAFLALRARYQLAYAYGDAMGAWLLAAGCLLLFGGLALLLWKRAKARVALALLCVAALVGCIFYQANVESAYRFVVERSPKGGHTLILRTDTDNGKTMLYRPFFLWYARPSSQFPYTVDGEVKTQWLASDVCAVTYQSADGKVHQFVATYGRRDADGVSYLPMTGVLQNTWRAEADTSAGWQLVVGEGGIDVIEGYNKYHYSYDDCVQFGRLAVALCRDGLPEWTIALGDDVLLDQHDRIQYGGTAVLCQVAMGKTAPVTFVAQNGRPEPEDNSAAEAKANGKALYEEMRAILKNDPALESTELEGGFWAVRTDSTDPAEVGRLAFAADVRRGEVTGVTFTYQINSMQVLAGDENDFLMDYDSAMAYQDGAGGEVAENGYVPRYRLMRGEGVYLAAWVNRQTDGGYALAVPDMEQVYQVHWDARYRFTYPEGAAEAGAALGVGLSPQAYTSAANPYNRLTEEDADTIYLPVAGKGFMTIDKATGEAGLFPVEGINFLASTAGFYLEDGGLYFCGTEFSYTRQQYDETDAADWPRILLYRMEAATGELGTVAEFDRTQFPAAFGLFEGYTYLYWYDDAAQPYGQASAENTFFFSVRGSVIEEAPYSPPGVDMDEFKAVALGLGSHHFDPHAGVDTSEWDDPPLYTELWATDAWYSLDDDGTLRRYAAETPAGAHWGDYPQLGGADGRLVNYDADWLYVMAHEGALYRISKETGALKALFDPSEDWDRWLAIYQLDVVDGMLYLYTAEGLARLPADGSGEIEFL